MENSIRISANIPVVSGSLKAVCQHQDISIFYTSIQPQAK
jgi:hypothetical protein